MKKQMKGFVALLVMAVFFAVSGMTAEAYGYTQTAQDKTSVTITWGARAMLPLTI